MRWAENVIYNRAEKPTSRRRCGLPAGVTNDLLWAHDWPTPDFAPVPQGRKASGHALDLPVANGRLVSTGRTMDGMYWCSGFDSPFLGLERGKGCPLVGNCSRDVPGDAGILEQ